MNIFQVVVHTEQHPLAGKTVTLPDWVTDPVFGEVVSGADYRIEDWFDRLIGKSWMLADGNPAALKYAVRTGTVVGDAVRNGFIGPIPMDNEVVYGKIGHAGHLVHATELSGAAP